MKIQTASPVVHENSITMAETAPTVPASIEVSFNPNEALMKFLQMAQTELGRATVQSDAFTMRQIFEIIRDYVKKRKLYDIKDPSVVCCGQDALGQVFGVEQFTKQDVLNLICKNSARSSFSVKTAKSVSQSEEQLVSSTTEAENVRKRHIDVDVEASPCRKKILFEDSSEQNESLQTSSTQFTLGDLLALSVATVTKVDYDSDIETVFSIQSKVTDIVKDSTDDLWFLETDTDDDGDFSALFGDSSDDDVYENELELMSEPGSGNAAEHSDSDDCIIRSGHEDIVIICESDLEFFADCEDGDMESDDDLSGDKWTCSNCSTNNCAIRRFCDFCWTLRPDWLTAKSQGMEQSCSNSVVTPITTSDSPIISTHCSTMATNSATVATDCSIVHSDCLTVANNNFNVSTDCSISSTDLSNTSEMATTAKGDIDKETLAAQPSKSVESQPNGGLCVICLAAPKDASIVHGSTGHQACCLHCAKQLKSRRQPCPVCRRPIHRVIRNYYV